MLGLCQLDSYVINNEKVKKKYEGFQTKLLDNHMPKGHLAVYKSR